MSGVLLPPLYHWSPPDRREAIRAEGLVPARDPVCNSEPAGHLSFGTSPAAAWALSGAVHAAAGQAWDLWQVRLAPGDEVRVTPSWGPEIREVRVHNPVLPYRLWWVAARDI